MKIYLSGSRLGDWEMVRRIHEDYEELARGLHPDAQLVNPLNDTSRLGLRLKTHKRNDNKSRYAREALRALMECEAVAFVPGYFKCGMARLEHWLAHELEFEIFYL